MTKDTREIFVKNLRSLMADKNKQQSDLAKDLNLPFTTIANWYHGVRYPRPDKLQILADYFNVEIENLVSIPKQKKEGVKIPILGRVIAGVPITAVEEILGYEEISEQMAKTGEYFALRIQGTSMEPKMSEGDIVIVRHQDTVENGQIAIVLVNGDEATVKKVKFRDDGIELIAFNSYVYEPHFYSKKEIAELPVKIIGRVVELRAKF